VTTTSTSLASAAPNNTALPSPRAEGQAALRSRQPPPLAPAAAASAASNGLSTSSGRIVAVATAAEASRRGGGGRCGDAGERCDGGGRAVAAGSETDDRDEGEPGNAANERGGAADAPRIAVAKPTSR